MQARENGRFSFFEMDVTIGSDTNNLWLLVQRVILIELVAYRNKTEIGCKIFYMA